MKRALIGVAGCLCGLAFADTVTLTDGSTLNGKATQLEDGRIQVRCGGATIEFYSNEVTDLQLNDKTGTANDIRLLNTKRFEDAIKELTGLDRDQREMVQKAMAGLYSQDENVRADARKQLIELNRRMPVMKFLENEIVNGTGRGAPQIMRAMFAIDPVKALPRIEECAMHVHAAIRAEALTLLGETKTESYLMTIARGMIDLDDTVRATAAHALAKIGSRRATPALIEGLKSVEPRVQNASLETLKLIWGIKEDQQPPLKNTADWMAFWAANAQSVPNPVDPLTEGPLVSEEDIKNAPISVMHQ